MEPLLNESLEHLEKVSRPVRNGQGALREEFGLLFKTGLVDRAMALARARRLLEVLVLDRYIDWKGLAPPYGKLPNLFGAIEEMLHKEKLPWPVASLCHAVRLEGNRALHYNPGGPRTVEVSDETLINTLRNVLEVAEALSTKGFSVYSFSVPHPFDAMYQRLRGQWTADLGAKREGMFPLAEALDLLFRSLVWGMKPAGLRLLEKYAGDNRLPPQLPEEEEHGLRQLRNLGLIEHDGKWLFTPRHLRSTRAWPTASGKFLLALEGKVPGEDPEALAREVVRVLDETDRDEEAVRFLYRVQQTGRLSRGEEDLARKLRNRHLLTHETYFLAGADRVQLTELGYYVLGKHVPE
jgi:hypothetical protein